MCGQVPVADRERLDYGEHVAERSPTLSVVETWTSGPSDPGVTCPKC